MVQPAGAALQDRATVSPAAALSPYIDTHVHFDAKILANPDGEVAAALKEMAGENAEKLIFSPGPFLPDDANRFDHEAFMAAAKKHPQKLAFLGGGGSLNGMIQEAIRSAKVDAETQKKFKERAEQILRDGAAGFGEMSAEHLSVNPGQAYETAPPDHPLYLLLADIAANHDVPVDLHLDLVPGRMRLPLGLKSPPNPVELEGNVAGLERLLDHNQRAKIVWAHAGSDSIGYRTPDFCRGLLRAHPNLYMEIKIDPLELGKNPPLADGKIKPEWLKLFSDFPDRFMIGTDQHYAAGRTMTGPQRWSTAVLLLNQLPADVRRKIGAKNALHIFKIAETK
jgi:predicted TIM-barrel fold metal-dependent hydrolase